jgi:hypothetical protein
LAEALHPNTVSKQKEWLTENCRELKHEKGKAGELLNLMGSVLNLWIRPIAIRALTTF